uniref:DUF1618 domain-containing protein n=1 Tax=Leersia perrieri TaxID=77586 RepID=A0A0D9XGX4_9ORYZ
MKKILDASLRPPTHGGGGEARPTWPTSPATTPTPPPPNPKPGILLHRASPTCASTALDWIPTSSPRNPRFWPRMLDLVPFRVTLGPRSNCFDIKYSDLFLYQANTAAPPSLRLIALPAIDRFFDYKVGILRRHDKAGAGAGAGGKRQRPALCKTLNLDYVLHLYRGGGGGSDGGWSWHPLSIHGPVDVDFTHIRVITIGGTNGTMGWVDLYRGILFCDLLPISDTTTPVLRYFPLPPPLRANDKFNGEPRTTRDIALVHGQIKYAEIESHLIKKINIDGSYNVSRCWTAATWSAPAANPWSQGWRHDCKLASSDLSVDDDTRNFQLLPKFGERPQHTLARLHTAHPTLSLDTDDVVFFMTKVDLRVLAVDMKNKRLKDVSEFGAERTLGIRFAYTSSRISDHLPTTYSR